MTAVLRLVDDPNASPKAFEKVVERDPGIIAKVLRVANSSYYGMSNVATIGRAVSVLGMNTLKSLVVSVAYQQMLEGKAAAESFDKLAFWRHSLGTATAARLIAKLCIPMKAEEVYVAGMMHDVGVLAMEKFCPEKLEIAIKTARSQRILLYDAERRALDCNHTEVGVLLAQQWGFSPIVRNAVQYHHDPLSDQEHAQTTAIVAVANSLAYEAGMKNQTPGCILPMEEGLLEAAGIVEEQLPVVRSVINTEVERAEIAFIAR